MFLRIKSAVHPSTLSRTQRSKDMSVSEKPLMGFHVPSDAFEPKNRIETWPSEYKHPKRKRVNQDVEDRKGEASWLPATIPSSTSTTES